MTAQRVAVWWLDVSTVAETAWPALAARLGEDERARAQRFHFDHDRLCYVAAHALGRGALAAWTGIASHAWAFAADAFGKPEVAAPAWRGRLRLNLSHTRGVAAAALCEEHDVGVDVEWLERRPVEDGLAQRFFAPAECAQLAALPPAARHHAFLDFWTLKEAYVKAIGKGLAQPLDSFAFTLDPLAIAFDDRLSDDPSRWLFRRLRPTPSHVLALALRHPDPASVAVETRAMSAEELLAYP
ncbi:MAG: 4'-phosphopantetheinyl transferase superfamily protein [Magnetospirillum sp.]|nr:4'-phosphopantetheinyl transferase superfamily protein [Magnetospirillum sp.]